LGLNSWKEIGQNMIESSKNSKRGLKSSERGRKKRGLTIQIHRKKQHKKIAREKKGMKQG